MSFFFYVCMRVYVKHIHEEISTSFCMICFHYNHICSVFYSSGVLGYMECNMSEFCILHSPHPCREDVPVESHRLPGSLPVLRPCSGIASACRRQQVLESSALSLSLSRAVGWWRHHTAQPTLGRKNWSLVTVQPYRSAVHRRIREDWRSGSRLVVVQDQSCNRFVLSTFLFLFPTLSGQRSSSCFLRAFSSFGFCRSNALLLPT